MTCEVKGGQLVIAGAIDENCDLVRMLDHEIDGKVVLDLGGVTFINSLGVREWIRMQQAAATAQITIELRRVAEPIVHQLNIVPAARGASVVTSFFAPYECDHCDREHLMLLDVRTHAAELAKQKAPPQTCPDCNRPLMFSDPDELYFGFLGS
jgi:hypothetical protein